MLAPRRFLMLFVNAMNASLRSVAFTNTARIRWHMAPPQLYAQVHICMQLQVSRIFFSKIFLFTDSVFRCHSKNPESPHFIGFDFFVSSQRFLIILRGQFFHR